MYEGKEDKGKFLVSKPHLQCCRLCCVKLLFSFTIRIYYKTKKRKTGRRNTASVLRFFFILFSYANDKWQGIQVVPINWTVATSCSWWQVHSSQVSDFSSVFNDCFELKIVPTSSESWHLLPCISLPGHPKAMVQLGFKRKRKIHFMAIKGLKHSFSIYRHYYGFAVLANVWF